MPLNIAANLLTFIGFLLLPVSFIVLSYYDYDFTRSDSIPRWVWFMCLVNNFMSHTLGKWINVLTLGKWTNVLTLGKWTNVLTLGKWSNVLTLGKWTNVLTLGKWTNVLTLGK